MSLWDENVKDETLLVSHCNVLLLGNSKFSKRWSFMKLQIMFLVKRNTVLMSNLCNNPTFFMFRCFMKVGQHYFSTVYTKLCVRNKWLKIWFTLRIESQWNSSLSDPIRVKRRFFGASLVFFNTCKTSIRMIILFFFLNGVTREVLRRYAHARLLFFN